MHFKTTNLEYGGGGGGGGGGKLKRRRNKTAKSVYVARGTRSLK